MAIKQGRINLRHHLTLSFLKPAAAQTMGKLLDRGHNR